MKKLLLIIVATLFVAITTTKAKEPFKPRISLGATAIFEAGIETGVKIGGTTSEFAVIVRPGISFDVQLSKHSGIETGLYYRHNIIKESYINSNASPDEKVFIPEYRDNRMLIPLYYKFYSRILNFAAGAEVSFNLNSNKKNSFSKIDYAFLLRISKDFNLYQNHLYIEPLLQASYGNIAWWGVGVGLKYRF